MSASKEKLRNLLMASFSSAKKKTNKQTKNKHKNNDI
jgi:hypothetical protein